MQFPQNPTNSLSKRVAWVTSRAFCCHGQGVTGRIQQTSVLISISEARVQASFSGNMLTNLSALNR